MTAAGSGVRRASQELIAGLKRALREPLVQFGLVGAALFLVFGGFSGNPEREIVIDPALRERISRAYRAQMGTYPNAGEMDALLERYVREEMLYREALRQGLDQGDAIIRQRLIQKMEFAADILPEDVPEDELRAYFAGHEADFSLPARASIRLLYFDPDREGWDKAEARAAAALAAGRTATADRSPLQAEYASLGPQDAIQLFGDSELAKAIYAAPLGRWSGPFRSGYGWHLLLVGEREAAQVPSFEEVRDRVASAFVENARSERIDAMVEALRLQYRVREVAGGD
ncbi:MAG TPA: peptidylprolyl isomerase [Sphingomonadaceae bacterium]|nr:peptidylprolyl isomerase [Sphingomonadaceae bacterium]